MKNCAYNKTAGIFLFFSFSLFLIFTDPCHGGPVKAPYLTDLSTVHKALFLIKNDFIMGDKDEKQLLYGAIKGMLKELDDPYTRFVNPEQFKQSLQEMEGEFGGVGMIITLKDEYITVISPVRGTPAHRNGIISGDRIMAIDGISTEGMGISQVMERLKGQPGSGVNLLVFRPLVDESIEISLCREIIKTNSIDRTGLLSEGIGYIRISSFTSDTASDLDKSLESLKKAGIHSMVLDLRDNPGGLLEAGVDVAQRFLDRGEIVSIKDRYDNITSYTASEPSDDKTALVVLINRGSASASEIVAGALKDNSRAILMGEKSYGKGCVQSVVPLEDGSAVILTTGWYYTPSGASIHELGLEPDFFVSIPDIKKFSKEELASEIKRYEEANNEVVILSQNGILPLIPVGKFDLPLQRAMELLRGSYIMKNVGNVEMKLKEQAFLPGADN